MMIIGFSTPNSLFGRIMRWLTNSKASHSYAVFDTNDGRLVIHSNAYAINTDYYSKFMNIHNIVAEYAILVPEELVKKVCACAVEKLDDSYDFCSIINFLSAIINKIFGRKVKNSFRNKSVYFCSDLILIILRSMNIQESFKLDHITSPEGLIQLLDKLPFAKRMI